MHKGFCKKSCEICYLKYYKYTFRVYHKMWDKYLHAYVYNTDSIHCKEYNNTDKLGYIFSFIAFRDRP